MGGFQRLFTFSKRLASLQDKLLDFPRMDSRAPQAYGYYTDLAARSEYLLVGLIAASIAFFWQNGQPAKLGLNPATLHLGGLTLLLLAMLLALSRLHKQPTYYALMSQHHDLAAMGNSLVISASKGETVVIGSKGRLSPAEQFQYIEEINKDRASLQKAMSAINAQLARLYRLRNYLLFSGYTTFLIERIWSPYCAHHPLAAMIS